MTNYKVTPDNIKALYNSMSPGLVPSGGTAGQTLVKASDADRDLAWQDFPGGGALPGITSLEDVSWAKLATVTTMLSLGIVLAEDVQATYSELVGQTKTVTIDGYGDFAFQLIGLAHDDITDASIKAGFTFMSKDIVTTHSMNSSSSAVTWAASGMRTWLEDTLFAALPSELQSTIKAVNKKGYSYGMSASGLTTSSDRLWLVALHELSASAATEKEGEPYQYWAEHSTSADRIKYLDSTAKNWWSRTRYKAQDSQNEFYYISNTGATGAQYHCKNTTEYGVVPCFCI